MKVLFLTHSFPYPPNDGMRSTCYQLIKHISQRHQVGLLCFIESEREKEHLPELQKHCKWVETVPHAVPRSFSDRLANIFTDPVPFCVSQFYSEEFAERLKALLQKESFDAVHFLSVNISNYLDCLGKTPALFFPHDSVSMQFYRNATREPNLFRKIYLYSQFKKMKQYERTMIPRFSQTVMVSEVDKKWVNQFLPAAPISIIPAGVDPSYFKPEGSEDPMPSVIFRGVMNFLPNVDSVLYFHSEIMPIVQREFPGLLFYVVGKDPDRAVQKLHDGTRTFVTGLVDDIRPYMAKATITVCPMRIGSGIKNKILEACAMGKATVATSLACDGIEVEHGQHLFIADSAEAFAKNVIELLKSPALRKFLGQNGRDLVIEKYGWNQVAALYGNLYQKMADGSGKK